MGLIKVHYRRQWRQCYTSAMHPTFGSVVPSAMFWLQPYSTLTGQTRDVTLTDQNASQNCLISLINNLMAFTLGASEFSFQKKLSSFSLFASWLGYGSLPGFSVESVLPAAKDGSIYKNKFIYIKTSQESAAGCYIQVIPTFKLGQHHWQVSLVKEANCLSIILCPWP